MSDKANDLQILSSEDWIKFGFQDGCYFVDIIGKKVTWFGYDAISAKQFYNEAINNRDSKGITRQDESESSDRGQDN